MLVIQVSFWMLVLFGHAALWVALLNRLHACGWPRKWVALVDRVDVLMLLLGGGAWIWWIVPAVMSGARPLHGRPALAVYAFLCAGAGLYMAVLWGARRYRKAPRQQLISNDTRRRDIARELGVRPAFGLLARSLDLVPGNQIFELHMHEKRLALPGLPDGLQGLRIVHLSDLHFTGRVGRAYFDALVEHVNAEEADLVAVTGDFIDHPACLPWLPDTLGRLRSRDGIYFILGNHDRRAGHAARIRDLLTESGLIDLGRRCHRLQRDGCDVLLAGNELPWFGPPPDLTAASGDHTPTLRILLSHSPDQLPWARRHGFQLMLAGHTHGGQICLPVIGPVVTPSMYGVKYASGVFSEPPTLLHVTRGVSGKTPIRWNCPPEVAWLVLTSAEGGVLDAIRSAEWIRPQKTSSDPHATAGQPVLDAYPSYGGSTGR